MNSVFGTISPHREPKRPRKVLRMPPPTPSGGIGIGVFQKVRRIPRNPDGSFKNQTIQWTYEMDVELFSIAFRYKQKFAVPKEEIDWKLVAQELDEKGIGPKACKNRYRRLRGREWCIVTNTEQRRIRKKWARRRVYYNFPRHEMTPDRVRGIMKAMDYEGVDAGYMDRILAQCKDHLTPLEWQEMVNEVNDNNLGYVVPKHLMQVDEDIDVIAKTLDYDDDIDYDELEQ